MLKSLEFCDFLFLFFWLGNQKISSATGLSKIEPFLPTVEVMTFLTIFLLILLLCVQLITFLVIIIYVAVAKYNRNS